MQSSDWGGYSSGSDGASEVGETPVAKNLPTDCDSDTTLYPVKFRDLGSMYANVLYDVEGAPLKDENGNYLNVKTKALKDAFDSQKVRLIHRLKEPSYRYFVTSANQQRLFERYRSEGAPRKIVFNVYLDEDADRTSVAYHSSFLATRSKSRSK